MGVEERGMDTRDETEQRGKKEIKTKSGEPIYLRALTTSLSSVLWPRVGTARLLDATVPSDATDPGDLQNQNRLVISFLIRPVERGYDAASGCGSPPIHCQAPLCRGHRRVEISLRSEVDRWQWQCRLAWLSPTACSTEGIRQGVGRDSSARPA